MIARPGRVKPGEREDMNLQEYLHRIDSTKSRGALENLLNDAAVDDEISSQDYYNIRKAVINKLKEEKS